MSPREKCSAVNKAERIGDVKNVLTSYYENTKCGVFPAGFQSCFCSLFLCYVPFPPFWYGNIYSVALYVGNMKSAFLV